MAASVRPQLAGTSEAPNLTLSPKNKNLGDLFDDMDFNLPPLDAPLKTRLPRLSKAELDHLPQQLKNMQRDLKRRASMVKERLREARFQLNESVKGTQQKAKDTVDRKVRYPWRKFVTGDGKTRIRDYAREKRQQQPTVMMLDQFAMMFGIVAVLMTQYVMTVQTAFFCCMYMVVMFVQLVVKYRFYKTQRWQLFMLDFCYLANFLCFVTIAWSALAHYINPESVNASGFVASWECSLHRTLWMCAMGPLAWAIPLWRCSLVFHDMDRMSSLFIHAYPFLLVMSARFFPQLAVDADTLGFASRGHACWGGDSNTTTLLTWFQFPNDAYMAVGVYLLWQVVYLIVTEGMLDKWIEDNNMITSLRYLTTSPKMGIHQLALSLMRALKVFKKDEGFDKTSLKTKLIFCSMQLVYTILTMGLATYAYYSFNLTLWLSVAFVLKAIHNGAGFYIKVFSNQYIGQFEQGRVKQKIPKQDRVLLASAGGSDRSRVASDASTGSLQCLSPVSSASTSPRGSFGSEADLSSGGMARIASIQDIRPKPKDQ